MNTQHEFSILIVDDQASNLYTLNRILYSRHRVHTAKSGKMALKMAQEDKPDIILLDIIMPDMDGFEVLSELKKNDLTRDIPVIIITGLATVEAEQKGFMLGAVDYITKPFDSSIVGARIDVHLRIVKQMRMIEKFGMIDVLTEIPNRRSFDSQISAEWGRAVREKATMSLLMIDLDRFKDYNDKYGHLQGDAMLKAIAKVFVTTARRSTDLVFRWGGEEFAVLLPYTDKIGAMAVAESIRANTAAEAVPSMSGGPPTYTTISIGVAEASPALGGTIEELIGDADKALYTAKQTGRNKVCISGRELLSEKGMTNND